MTIERPDRITRIVYSRARIGFVSICIVSALATLSTLTSYQNSFALAPAEASRSLRNENKPDRTINLSAAGTLSYHALKRKKQQEKQSSKNLYSQVMKPSSSSTSEGLSYRELQRKQQMDLRSNRISSEIMDRYDDDETITNNNNDDEVTTLLFGRRSRDEPAKAYRLGTWPRTTPLHKLVQGPAAPYHNGSQLIFPYANETDVVCHFEQKGSWDHFPHSMQQLYRCWSWWQHAHPTGGANNKTKVLMIWNIPNAYVRGYLEVIQQVFGVVLDRTAAQRNHHRSVTVAAPGTEYQSIPAYEMHHPRDAQALRDGIVQYYNNVSTTTTTTNNKERRDGMPVAGKPRHPVIGILNRQGGRRIINHQEIAKALQSQCNIMFPSVDPHDPNATATTSILYMDSFDNQTFLEQVRYMSQVDILIAPHGAQLTSLAFLPTCAGVLEIFPKGYYVPKFFGSLARSTGHEYYSLYTGSVANQTEELQYYMRNLHRREQARKFNMTVDPLLVMEASQELVTKWKQCRYQQFQEQRQSSKAARLEQ